MKIYNIIYFSISMIYDYRKEFIVVEVNIEGEFLASY